MDELDYCILDCLSKNMTILEIIKVIKKRTGKQISNYNLLRKLQKLKKNGYLIDRWLTENGIIFTLLKNLDIDRKFEINSFQTERFIFFSDSHIGNINDKIILLDKLYDYAQDNYIKFMIFGGDWIEGIRSGRPSYSRLATTQEQLDEAIRNYPKRNNIYTAMLLGNHDMYSIEDIGLDIRKQIENKRADIITLGYISSRIRFNNINVTLHHNHNISTNDGRNQFLHSNIGQNSDIVFAGHCHEGRMLVHNDVPFIFSPPMFPGKNANRREGAYECKFVSRNGNHDFDFILISPLVLNNETEVYPITTVEYPLKTKTLIK